MPGVAQPARRPHRHRAVRVLEVARHRARAEVRPAAEVRVADEAVVRFVRVAEEHGHADLAVHAALLADGRRRDATASHDAVLADVARSDEARERRTVAPRRTSIGPAVESNTTYGSIDAPRSTRAGYAPTTAAPDSAALTVSQRVQAARNVRRQHVVQVPNEVPHLVEPPPGRPRPMASRQARATSSVAVPSRNDSSGSARATRTAATRPSTRPDRRGGIRGRERDGAPRVGDDRARGGGRARPWAARRAPRSRRGAARRRSRSPRRRTRRSQRRRMSSVARAQLARRAASARTARTCAPARRRTARRCSCAVPNAVWQGGDERLEVGRVLLRRHEREPVACDDDEVGDAVQHHLRALRVHDVVVARSRARPARSTRCRDRPVVARGAATPTSRRRPSRTMPGITRTVALRSSTPTSTATGVAVAKKRVGIAAGGIERGRELRRQCARTSARKSPTRQAKIPEFQSAPSPHHALGAVARSGFSTKRSTRFAPPPSWFAGQDVAEPRVRARRHDAHRDERRMLLGQRSPRARAPPGSRRRRRSPSRRAPRASPRRVRRGARSRCAAHASAPPVPTARGSAIMFSAAAPGRASRTASDERRVRQDERALGAGRAAPGDRACATSSGRLVDERQELLGTRRGAQRPEARADAAGEHDGPAAHAVPAPCSSWPSPASSAVRA